MDSPKKRPANRQSVQSTGEAVFLPNFDGVRPTLLVQLAIRIRHVIGNPGALLSDSIFCAGGDNSAESLVEAHFELASGK